MKENSRQRPWVLAILTLLLFVFFLTGCGRKGNPVAPENTPSDPDLSGKDREPSN